MAGKVIETRSLDEFIQECLDEHGSGMTAYQVSMAGRTYEIVAATETRMRSFFGISRTAHKTTVVAILLTNSNRDWRYITLHKYYTQEIRELLSGMACRFNVEITVQYDLHTWRI